MGFIKAIASANSSQLQDTYREVIRYENKDKNLLIKKITTPSGVIQNESRLFVEPGQCAIYTDNGAIKDIISEPGMYFMDTQAPSLFQVNIFKGLKETFLETMKRVAYEGKEITTQAVYFVSLAELLNLGYASKKTMLFKDPEWGPMEISLAGSYGVRVNNPMNLLTNVNSNADEFYFSNIQSQVNDSISQGIMSSLNSLNASFDSISEELNKVIGTIILHINSELENLGVEITRIAIGEITVPEEIKKAMHERTGIRMKATSVDDKGADIYTKLNTAEAIKDMANNPNNSGTTIMGMNVGNAIAGVVNKNINPNEENPQ